ncbi:MAG: helix-turn-helix domain-containing protein [Bacteroidetes bacterium]|jgi:AraC-like DNA-binding protein|nr:helix-turn-helix domain-containing protein [Bacteroidota bacterium]
MHIVLSEYKPAPAVDKYIQSYWTGEFNRNREQHFVQSILPNGYIELIIHITHYHCALTTDQLEWKNSPDFTIIGMYTKPYEVHFKELVKVFGIRFYPEGISNIFGISPSEFLATYEDSTSVLGKKFKDFCSRIRDAATIQDRVNMANQFMLKKLNDFQKHFDYTQKAMELIRQYNGMLNLNILNEYIPISARQLQREFKKRYGITTKEYIRLARFNAIQKYMQAGHTSLTQAGYELGFADQSHFIREFRNFAGAPPRAFMSNRGKYGVIPLHDGH